MDSRNAPATESFPVGSSTFHIAPQEGFRLMRWSLHSRTGTREILHWPEDDGQVPFHKIRGGNPLLFPFCGRTYDRGIEDSWRDPEGKRLPMPRHGFARDGQFEVTHKTDASIEAVLRPDERAQKAYPFDYRFHVAYTFEELSLKATFRLENKGARPIPWSAGHHFYFTLPWHPSARRKDYLLHMESRKCAYHGPDGKLVMEKDRTNCHDIADPSLLDRIHWELRHNRVAFGPRGGEEDVHIVFGENPVPHKSHALVTWSESEDAPYYCIEPWMGPPNSPEHGKGLHWVNPGDTDTFAIQISLY